MKILKRAKQKNFELDTFYYTESQIEQMHNEGKLFTLNEIFKDQRFHDDTYRIGAEDIKEVKIIYCDEFWEYLPVAVLKTGETIHIKL